MVRTGFIVVLFLFSVSPVLLFGDADKNEVQKKNGFVNLEDYMDLALKVPDSDLLKIENEIGNAESKYLYAVQSNESQLYVKKADMYLEKLRNYRTELQSEIAVNAVSLYISLLQAERALDEKNEQLSINVKEEKIAELRLSEGVKESAEYSEQKELTLESRIAVVKAENDFINAYRKFLHGMGMKYPCNNQIFPEKHVSAMPLRRMDFTECLVRAESINSSCIYNHKMYELYKSHYDKIAGSDTATEKEKNCSRINAESYRIDYEVSEKDLEDEVWSLVSENNITLDILELMKARTEAAEKQVEIKKAEYLNGTVFKTEVLQAALDYKESENDLITETEKGYLNYLKLKAAISGDIRPSVDGH